MTMGLREVARLSDPEFYASDPYEVYAQLRREAPVYWDETAQLWALSKYEDIRSVLSRSRLFSSVYGVSPAASIPHDDGSDLGVSSMPRRAELRKRHVAEAFGGNPDAGLQPSDDPAHMAYRRVVSSAFTPKMIAGLRTGIEEIMSDLLAAIEPGSVADLVHAFASPLPAFVIAHMLGVERDRWEDFARWADAFVLAWEGGEGEEVEQAKALVGEFFEYIAGALAARKQNPRDDLLSGLVHAEVDGLRLNESEQVTMAVTLLVAGNETVRAMLSGGSRLFAEHPDQRHILIGQPDLIANAVEEILRCTSPILNFCRTATESTEIRGRRIERGDYLLLLFVAGNRDEEIWERPDVFDITRTPDPTHLAFGFGTHFCLGAALARLEGQIAFRQLMERFPNFELAGEVIRTRSTATSNINTMPVLFK